MFGLEVSVCCKGGRRESSATRRLTGLSSEAATVQPYLARPGQQQQQQQQGTLSPHRRTQHTTHRTRLHSCRAASQNPSPGQGGISSHARSHATQLQVALKEWEPICAALQAGDQTVLLRKGGIRDPSFEIRSTQFALLGTGFHNNEQLLKHDANPHYHELCEYDPGPVLSIAGWVECTAAWNVLDPIVLEATDPFHIWGPSFVHKRLRWKEEQPITLLETRVHSLRDPIMFNSEERFWGCFSWVDLPADVATALLEARESSSAVLNDVEFAQKQEELRDRLHKYGIDVPELVL